MVTAPKLAGLHQKTDAQQLGLILWAKLCGYVTLHYKLWYGRKLVCSNWFVGKHPESYGLKV
jgi:hypothetical protein